MNDLPDDLMDALRDLARAVSIDPGNPFEYFYLGRAYIARRNYGQALTFFQRAEIGFAARPDWLGATVAFEGTCYEELGQYADAAKAYQRALGTAPANLSARVGYSRLASYLPPPPVADAVSRPFLSVRVIVKVSLDDAPLSVSVPQRSSRRRN